VRIPVPSVDEREQQAITPDVSFHTMMQDMQQRMDSMATAVGTLNVELNNSRQASQYPSFWSQARESSSSRSKAVKKEKKQREKSYNTTNDDRMTMMTMMMMMIRQGRALERMLHRCQS
jgi:hypothetical protein